MNEEIQKLEDRIKELEQLLIEHGKTLNDIRGIYSPYLDREIEQLKHKREKIFNK